MSLCQCRADAKPITISLVLFTFRRQFLPDHSMKSSSSALYYSPPAAITTRAKHCTVFVGGITGLYWKSEIWAMTKSSVELLYCTSPNQTQHCPVSHIATSLVRLSLIHARLLMVDMLTDISWSFSFWVVLIALEKLKEQLCLNCSKLSVSCCRFIHYMIHD